MRHTPTLYFPPTAMGELGLDLRAPTSSWRTVLELYTLRRLEYRCTRLGGPYSGRISTKRYLQARCKDLVTPMDLDPPVATVLPKATEISWPFASWGK